ncbi:MAG: fimbrillin family protein [Alistipes sp.]|nr:fimbrillin family protein [Alistipes sp.]
MFRNFLFLVAFCGAFASCSTKQDLDVRESERAIRLGAGGVDETPRTKTVVNSLADLASAGVGDNIGICGVRVNTKTAEPVAGWGNVLPMDNVRTTGVSAADGAISWNGVYLYPLDDAYVKFCAYHPYASYEGNGRLRLDAPSTGKAPFLSFTLSGEDDIMYATPVVGRKDDAPKPLMFHHVLTQLTFEIIDDSGTLVGEKIQSIEVLDVNTSSTMNIETGALGTWGSKANLAVAGTADVEILSTSAQSVGRSIMLQPGQASFKVRVNTASLGSYTATIRPTSVGDNGSYETSFAAGRSYLISLRFDKTSELGALATVSEWLLMGYDEITIK